MNETFKQSVLELLAAAKTHIEAGETALAAEKIDEAIAVVENEGVEAANDAPSDAGGQDGEEGKPKDPPLPGQGTNGRP